MPCSRRRCTSRSRVRAEVMPMPDRRRSVIDAFQPGPDCGQCRVAGEVDLQGSHRDVSLGDGVEVGAGTRVLLRPGGTDPVHRTPARVLRAHDRLGTGAIAEPADAKAPETTMSCSKSNRPEIARCTQSVGVPGTKYTPGSASNTRSGTSRVSELLAPLLLRSGATTVTSASVARASRRRRTPSAR